MYYRFPDCPYYSNFRANVNFPPPPPGGPTGPMGGGVSQQGPPSGPPPSYQPSKAQAQPYHQAGVTPYAVDPRAIRRCRFKYVYIWLDNGRSFWAWLTYVGRRSVAGWRWQRNRWVYFGIDLRRIDSFICY